MSLRTYATDELEEELERRRALIDDNPRPAMIDEPDLEKLKGACRSYLDWVDCDGLSHTNYQWTIFDTPLHK